MYNKYLFIRITSVVTAITFAFAAFSQTDKHAVKIYKEINLKKLQTTQKACKPKNLQIQEGTTPQQGNLRACPDLVASCGASYTGLSTSTGGADFNGDWECAPIAGGGGYISTTGNDYVIAITPSDNGEVEITMSNVSTSGPSDLVEVGVFTACPPPPGTAATYDCYQWFQYDALFQWFYETFSPTVSFSVTAGNTYYIIIANQIGDDVNFDIQLTCTATGISADTDCDAVNDPDQNGLYTTVNGSLTTCIDPSTTTSATICHTIYLQNPGWEWLKTVTLQAGACVTGVSNPTPTTGDGGFYDCCTFLFSCFAPGNDWSPSIAGTTITWTFEACDNPDWGDGSLLGDNYTCAAYTFCYNATIDPTCTDPSGFNDILTFVDDGIGGAGTTAPSQVVLGSGIGNCITLSQQYTISLTGKISFENIMLSWHDNEPKEGDIYEIKYRSESEQVFKTHTTILGNGESSVFSLIIPTSMFANNSNNVIFQIEKHSKDGNISFSNVLPISLHGEKRRLQLINPEGTSTIVTINEPVREIKRIRILDVAGRIMQEIYTENNHSGVVQLDHSISDGIYIIEVHTSSGVSRYIANF